MVYVCESQRLTQSEALTDDPGNSQSLNQSQTLTGQTLNESIGIMLRSYTRAINKQENRTGSLFKEHTKAECINCPNGITPSFIVESGITKINIQNPEEQYPQICFDYIHQNPVKAKLVKNITDWQFSSAMDYAGIRDGKLVDKEIAHRYVKY
jgi:putative transposase